MLRTRAGEVKRRTLFVAEMELPFVFPFPLRVSYAAAADYFPESNLRRGHSRGLISLGLIGVGPAWEHRYRPALKRLSSRVCIRAVHDPVLGRAQHAAQETNAEALAGLKQIFEHPALDGILVLDSSWYGVAPVELACERQRPAFLVNDAVSPPAVWSQLHESAQQRGVMLVPEMSWRFQPSTMRLRELIASRLGPVRALRVVLNPHLFEDESLCRKALAAAVDWCSFVSRQTAERLVRTVNGHSLPAFQLLFLSDLRGRVLEPAEICQCAESFKVGETEAVPFQAEVWCDNGRADVCSATRIAWSVSGGEECHEELYHERCEEEVMLDQFCRRLVGGLIPTATLQDVAVALQHVSNLDS